MPVDLANLAIKQQCYTLLTNNKGGIRDDLIICRRGEEDFLLVVNAACKVADLAYLKSRMSEDNQLGLLDHQALLALQGPASAEVITQLAPSLLTLNFMQASACKIAGVRCFVTRSGYTGEDGFEISLPSDDAETVARALLAFDQVAPAGLGARDSLRLEAGLSLYGHELNEQISPVEAGLSWTIPSSRRSGLRSQGKARIRAETELQTTAGQFAGIVTSGGYSPATESAIAMAYVTLDLAQPGTQLNALVRDKLRPVEVVDLPFVAHRYQQN